MTTLLIATRNAHKVQEIREILGPKFTCLTLDSFPGAPIVAEDAATFEGNARKKATTLSKWVAQNPKLAFKQASVQESPFYVVADDSGLEVDALGGAPGVHSARYAALDVAGAANSPDSANNAKLLRLLKDVPQEERTARFRCVLAVTRLLFSTMTQRVLPSSEQQALLFEGVCEGRISANPAGRGGFGYDPLFIPVGQAQSFGKLGAETKNKLSHRAQALEKLRRFLSK